MVVEEVRGGQAAFEGRAEYDSNVFEIELVDIVVYLLLIDFWSIDEIWVISKFFIFWMRFVQCVQILLFPFLFFEVVDALCVAHQNDGMIHNRKYNISPLRRIKDDRY